jgi:hypothetical protein
MLTHPDWGFSHYPDPSAPSRVADNDIGGSRIAVDTNRLTDLFRGQGSGHLPGPGTRTKSNEEEPPGFGP